MLPLLVAQCVCELRILEEVYIVDIIVVIAKGKNLLQY